MDFINFDIWQAAEFIFDESLKWTHYMGVQNHYNKYCQLHNITAQMLCISCSCGE